MIWAADAYLLKSPDLKELKERMRGLLDIGERALKLKQREKSYS